MTQASAPSTDDGLQGIEGAREWPCVGRAGNTVYYHPEPDVLVAMPVIGMVDDAQSARGNCEFQHAFWRKNGRSGAIVIFFDRVASQDKGARQAYTELSDPGLQTCAAMVGGTMLGRAMISFFMGLARPGIPTKLFKDYASALAWAREMNAAHSQPTES